jgi:hypothetical protein
MNRLAVVLTLAVTMAACGDSSRPLNPISPSVAPPNPTFTVSGTVVGQEGAPVEGVKVQVAGRQGTTDGNGNYTLFEVPRSYGGASAVKAGYAAAREILTVSGDTRFDVQLGPRVAIYTLSGVVSEVTPTGLTPVEGVLVHGYSCEEVLPAPPFFPGNGCPVLISQTVRTDKQGRYTFSGLYPGKKNSIGVSKEGFEDPFGSSDGPEGPGPNDQAVTIDGDTRLDVQLVRR